MKEKKKASASISTTVSETVPTKRLVIPAISVKRETLIRFGIGFLIALALIPALDWVIQTSIVSRYAAFYKDSDITRADYIDALVRADKQNSDAVLNELLAKAAISQAAKDRDINVTEEDITKAVDTDKTNAGITSDEAFQEALASSGLTEEEYRSYVRITVTLDKLLDGATAEPTEKEVSDYYTENKDTLFKDKKLEDVKAEIVTTLKQTDLAQKRQEWLSNALKDYKVDTNTFTADTSKTYKFLRSIELIKRLFSNDITK